MDCLASASAIARTYLIPGPNDPREAGPVQPEQRSILRPIRLRADSDHTHAIMIHFTKLVTSESGESDPGLRPAAAGDRPGVRVCNQLSHAMTVMNQAVP